MENAEKHYFQEALNHFLKQKKMWTQSWLADKVGVSQQTISNISKGTNAGRENTRLKIANAFNTSYIDFLLAGKRIYEQKNRIVNLSRDNSYHHSVIDEFENNELAAKFSEILVKIEKKDKKTFERLFKQAQFELAELEGNELERENLRPNKEGRRQSSGGVGRPPPTGVLVPWIEWIQIYNVYFVRSDGLIIQSWKPAKAQGVFHSDILTRGDLKIIIPAIEKVIAEKMPRFVTYRIFSHPYIALLKPFPERHDEIIAHETADSCGSFKTAGSHENAVGIGR